MDLDIAKYLRIAVPTPTDDFVEKRRKAVTDLAVRFRKRTTPEQFVALASNLTELLSGDRLTLSEGALRNEVITTIAKSAPAFVADESTELELSVCALLGAAQAVSAAQADSATSPKSAWLAAALWSGLSFLPERAERQIEALRIDMIEVARDFLTRHGEAARQRTPSPTDPLPKQLDGETITDYIKRLLPAIEKPMTTLRGNAELDREEIDLLWWVINDWSITLNQRFSTAAPQDSAVASGIEFAKLLARPPARAHRDLAVRNVHTSTDAFALSSFSVLDEKLVEFSTRMLGTATPLIQANPLVFPLLWILLAISKGLSDLPTEARRAGLRPDATLRLDEWARRALDETSLLKAMGYSFEPQATTDDD